LEAVLEMFPERSRLSVFQKYIDMEA
jgi:hypothetical protein